MKKQICKKPYGRMAVEIWRNCIGKLLEWNLQVAYVSRKEYELSLSSLKRRDVKNEKDEKLLH